MSSSRRPGAREVIIYRNVAGSAWLEAGRTRICPTPEWICEHYGVGQYELRLLNGREVLCVVRVAANHQRPAVRSATA